MDEYVGLHVNTDPHYWETLAKDDFAAATILAKSKQWGTSVLHSHAAVEKSLKRLLAIQGTLSEADRTHSICYLADKAGISDKLDPSGKAVLHMLNNLHEQASYPANLVKYRLINEEGFAIMVWNKITALIKFITEEAEELNGENKSGH